MIHSSCQERLMAFATTGWATQAHVKMLTVAIATSYRWDGILHWFKDWMVLRSDCVLKSHSDVCTCRSLGPACIITVGACSWRCRINKVHWLGSCLDSSCFCTLLLHQSQHFSQQPQLPTSLLGTSISRDLIHTNSSSHTTPPKQLNNKMSSNLMDTEIGGEQTQYA